MIGAVLTDPASGSELGQKCTLVRGGKRHTMVSPFFKSTFAILDPCESQYPFYPTMNQIFILYARLFFASLVLKDEQKTQALELLKNWSIPQLRFRAILAILRQEPSCSVSAAMPIKI
ncbi:hypothetical protein [Allobaculum sp. Allo2]|uniref:hypothetical protein n=1 Tax=Allobaculum sp. Allo2 TaxID=2853432 RepID=UPI001F60D00C|nr:hypothetical protein [Allobaculum sp. Allo2]UNT93914.1 hypothetical protein KWG61_04255 [Allobaculum sp. Allo2]